MSYRNKQGFTKPEYAIKRADELIALGRKNQALDALSTIATRRQRAWSKKLETLMVKFLSMCVELNKATKAKDGLYQFRSACLQQPQSLEIVLKHFTKESERAAEEAQEGEFEDPLSKVHLDPSLVNSIKTVSLEEYNRQTDSDKVKPWLKFLWETYRTVLEVLRNNAKLEVLYTETAKQAFAFCCKYNRTNEFRRLADLLRNHLGKHTMPPAGENEESIAFQLDIRFGQLNTAVSLELWQEAYKSVEDINVNLIIPAKTPIPQELLANYYLQLEKLFWVSKSYALHAQALQKYTQLKVEIEKELSSAPLVSPGEELTEEEREARAQKRDEQREKFKTERKVLYTRCLLAALCVPLSDRAEDPFAVSYDIQKEKELRLASLLDSDVHATRSFLLEELIGEKIFSKCDSELKHLYDLLEGKFQPFVFAREINKHVTSLGQHEEYKQYCSILFDTSFVKLLQQLSNIYQTMEIRQLAKLVPSLSLHEIEKRVVSAHRTTGLDCRIDHRQGVIHFSVSSLEPEDMRYKLAEVARNLRKCVEMINPSRKEIEKKRQEAFKVITKNIPIERKRIMERRAYIEKLKEEREAQEAIAQREADEEEKREKIEADMRELQRLQEKKENAIAKREKKIKDEQEKVKAAFMAAQLRQIAAAAGAPVAKIANKLEESEMTSEDFVKKQLEHVVEERRKRENLLNKESVKFDHLVRAQRELEHPLLEKKAQQDATDYQKYFKEQQLLKTKQEKEAFETQSKLKEKLSRMTEDYLEYKKKLDEQIRSEYLQKKEKRDAEVAQWRAARQEKMAKLAEEERTRAQAKKEEAERREAHAKEEAEQREAEAKKRAEEQRKAGPPKPWTQPASASPGPVASPADKARPWGPSADKAARPWGPPAASAAAPPPATRPRFDGPPPLSRSYESPPSRGFDGPPPLTRSYDNPPSRGFDGPRDRYDGPRDGARGNLAPSRADTAERWDRKQTVATRPQSTKKPWAK